MEIKIFKGDEEIKALPLEELDFIGALKFIPPALKEKRCKIENLENLVQELKRNKNDMEKDTEYVPITLVNEVQIEIPFEVFFDEIIDMLHKLIKLYQKKGGIEIVIE